MTSLNTYLQNNPPPTMGNSTAPSPISKYVTNPIKEAFSGGVNEIGSGYKEATQGNIGGLISGSAHMVEGLGGAIASPFAPIIKPTIGAGTNALANKISDNPTVQKFAMSPTGQATAKVAGAVGTGANIAGTVAGLQGGVETAGNIWDKAYSTGGGVDMATQALENQSKSAVDAQQTIDTSVGGFQKGLGESFGGATKQIEQIAPEARVTIPNDLMDKLNALKDTKKFALPDYLRTTSTEFGNGIKLGDIEKGGVSLSPSETQDLITKLNKLTYAAKASGDLEINQSTIGLNKDIHSLANEAFKDVKDTEGNAIWNKAYENYSKGINAVDKISDIFNSKKVTTASDFNKTMDTIKNLSKDPQGKVILQNAINEFKNTSGIDLTNPTQEIGKILESEEFLKESQKPSFLSQTFNKQYMSRTLVRIVEYAIFGTIIRNMVKSVSQ